MGYNKIAMFSFKKIPMQKIRPMKKIENMQWVPIIYFLST